MLFKQMNVGINTITFNTWDDGLSEKHESKKIQVTNQSEAAIDYLRNLGNELARYRVSVSIITTNVLINLVSLHKNRTAHRF
jgi:hypothetical protein